MDAKRAGQESPVDFIIGALADDALDEARLGINQLYPAAVASLL